MSEFEGNAQFMTTQWTQILDSRGGQSDSASRALIALCQTYHLPVLVFIQKRTHDRELAHDLCQGFFEHLIETKLYRKAMPERGRFRAFLLTAVKNYLQNEHRNATRQKRGSGVVHLSIEDDDGAFAELSSDIPPDALFDQQWAATLFENVWTSLRAEYQQLGQLDRFERLRPTIINPGKPFPFEKVAPKLQMSVSGAKSAAFRLKSRFRNLFRKAVAELVENPNEIDEEINYLIQAMSFVGR